MNAVANQLSGSVPFPIALVIRLVKGLKLSRAPPNAQSSDNNQVASQSALF
jgi:hypothetical protein